MTSSRIPLALAAAAALAAGCDRLATEPGSDFAVRVLTPTPITAIGRITVPLRFAVDGCSAFDASVRGGDGASHPVESARQADGTYLADVPVEWLRNTGSCLTDATWLSVSHPQVTITCRDAFRSATAGLVVRYGTARSAGAPGLIASPMEEVYPFPGAPRLLSYRHGGDVALVHAADSLRIELVPMRLDSGRRPQLAENGSSLFVVSGCLSGPQSYSGYFPFPLAPTASCPPIAVSASVSLPSEALWGMGLEPDGTRSRFGWWPVWVPAPVTDLAFLADGTLVVLSSSPAGTSVTRVVPVAPAPSECPAPAVCPASASVEVIGFYPGEQVQTGFSRTASEFLFVTIAQPSAPGGPLRSVLHATDGRTVTSLPDPTSPLDLGPAPVVQLSPDGRSLFVNNEYLGPPGGPWTPLPHLNDARAVSSGVWFGDRFALTQAFGLGFPAVYEGGGVHILDAAPPNARVSSYSVGDRLSWMGDIPGVLWGAVGVGDKLVLTTSTGVRILDRDGRLVGGAEPLPCGSPPTSLAIATGPMTAAVVAWPYAYVFDLADLP